MANERVDNQYRSVCRELILKAEAFDRLLHETGEKDLNGLLRLLIDRRMNTETKAVADSPPPYGRLSIYTDGSSRGNPGPGGWGAVFVSESGDVIRELSDRHPSTTNGRMELQAALSALESLPDGTQATLYSDSEYVIKSASQWLDGWVRNGWKKANGKAVENRDLMEQLLAQRDRHRIDWRWVKGHDANEWNVRADVLAGGNGD